jgi:hypothetical protein
MFLPDEILNLIFSFREINPVSLLIKDSVEKCHETYSKWVDNNPYYILSSLLYQRRFFMNKFDRLSVYYEKRDRKLTIKKKMKGINFTRNESIIQERNKDVDIISEKYETKMNEIRSRYRKLYNINDNF